MFASRQNDTLECFVTSLDCGWSAVDPGGPARKKLFRKTEGAARIGSNLKRTPLRFPSGQCRSPVRARLFPAERWLGVEELKNMVMAVARREETKVRIAGAASLRR